MSSREHSSSITIESWRYGSLAEESFPGWRLLINPRLHPATAYIHLPVDHFTFVPPGYLIDWPSKDGRFLEIRFKISGPFDASISAPVPRLIPHDLVPMIELICQSTDPRMSSRTRSVVEILWSDTKNGTVGKRQSFPEFTTYVERHLGHDLRVTTIARALGMGDRALRQRCIKQLGLPPREFIRQEKFNFAKKLLTNREISIDEIAERVGYIDRSSFSHAFKAHTGESPVHYRSRSSR